MICTRCKAVLNKDAQFCVRCGLPVGVRAANINRQNMTGLTNGLTTPPAKASTKKQFPLYILIPVGVFGVLMMMIVLSVMAYAIFGNDGDQPGNSYNYPYTNTNTGGGSSGTGSGSTGTGGGSSGTLLCPTCGGTGKCSICHGSNICQVCFGRGSMSYNTYGQGGSGKVTCQGCYGNRQCKYCSAGRCNACGGTGRYR